MMSRGPKQKTARNSRRGSAGIIRHEALEPPSVLTRQAREEYDRLVGVLQCKGTLDRVDLGVIAEAARVKALLDRLHRKIEKDQDDWRALNRLCTLTTQRQALLRGLGLTTQPCRSVVKANPIGSQRDEEPNPSPWAGKLKVS
jgi:phage terminase small subunit